MKRRFQYVIFAAAGLAACAESGGPGDVSLGPQGACSPDAELAIVCTAEGAVQGVAEGELVFYKGIPYAAPPTGALRWQPTQPPAAWEGVREASEFAPPCPQLRGDVVIGNEDCLYLNVWAPREPDASLRPVMVYLTGGGNHTQSGAGAGGVEFTGARLVPQGVVLVTVSIRLGALGFLTHPLLDAESATGTSGNWGNLDQIAMLQWVQRNIEAFGGDPRRVMLFGTSAGGANICGLMTSPLAEGLFHRAAMQSSVPTGCEYLTASEAQLRTGIPLAEALGCDSAACLREASPEDLVLALEAIFSLFPRTYGPVVDGYVFPQQPIERIRAGDVARIPVIIGNTSQEAFDWIDRGLTVTGEASFPQAVEDLFGGALRDRVVAEYPLSDFDSPRQAFVRVATDALFTCRTRTVARSLVEADGGPVFRYLFTHTLDNAPFSPPSHSDEMPHFFGVPGYDEGYGDQTVGRALVSNWTELAKSGRPSTAPATWPAVDERAVPYFELGPGLFPDAAADAHCDFWDSVELPRPHL